MHLIFKKDCILRFLAVYKQILYVCTRMYVCYTLSTRVSADGKLNFRSMLMRILRPLPTRAWLFRCWSCHHFWGLQVNGLFPPVLRASSSRKPRGSSSSSGSRSIMASWSPTGEARHAFVRIFYDLNSFASRVRRRVKDAICKSNPHKHKQETFPAPAPALASAPSENHYNFTKSES